MNLRPFALIALCIALSSSARADGPGDAAQVDRWIEQALHGKGEERDRAVRFLAALGGDAIDRLIAAARREGAVAPVAPAPVPVQPAPVVSPQPAPQPVPAMPQPTAVERRRYVVSGSVTDRDRSTPADVEAIEGEPTAIPGPGRKVVEYRREPRREASGSWAVAKDKILEGVTFEATVQPVDGKLRLTLTTRVTTVAQPIPTTTVRAAPDGPAVEIDAPEWSTLSETATADLTPGEEHEFRPRLTPYEGTLVLRLKVAPKP